MKFKKNNKKRLAMEIDINLHCEIKKRAAIRNITITDYVIMAIIERLQLEEKYD